MLRVINKVKKNGIKSTISKALSIIYNNTIWHMMPKKDGEYKELNGVPVMRKRVLDNLVPFDTKSSESESDYEKSLAKRIRSEIKRGETVVEIGGGIGVTGVIAAKCVGDRGKVISYEGSERRVRKAIKVAKLNKVSKIVNFENRIVGRKEETVRGQKDTKKVNIYDIPNADIAIIDCDGCELELISNLNHLPDKLIIEHHANIKKGIKYQPREVKRRIKSGGYKIRKEEEVYIGDDVPHFGEYEMVIFAVRVD